MAGELNELDNLAQDIINRFETALGNATTAELSSIVDKINISLERQANLVQNISMNSVDRVKQTKDEYDNVKSTTQEVETQSKLYQNILNHNEDIHENWDKIIKQSAKVNKIYKDIGKQQKQMLTSLNVAIKKEKQLTTTTLKRMKSAAKFGKGTNVNSGKKINTKIPQFVDIQGIGSNQLAIESLTGGKPYFASHPEMGVPLGLFNTKDEPNKSARIKAIQKYGIQGSISGAFPQYIDELPTVGHGDTPADITNAAPFLLGKIALKTALGKILDQIVEVVDTAKRFADKMEDYAGEADEAIRSAIQNAGILQSGWDKMFAGDVPLTKAAYFSRSMQQAAQELNLGEGIFASFEQLSELQKAFTEYTGTNVLLGKQDLKNLTYLQKTFDLAASDVAELQGSFMELGMSSEDMMTYTNDLVKEARTYGVNATKILKDAAKTMKQGASYRFKGGVSDMLKMQVYAANARFNIESAYNAMDKSLSIEGAIDLASQLQVLGGEFADISAMDLFAAAQSGDMNAFVDELVGRFRKDAKRFGKINEKGMFQFDAQGRLLLRAFQNIEGLGFDDDIEGIIEKAGKEEEVRRQLMGGVNKDVFATFNEEKQRKIIENLAQGSTDELNISGQKFKDQLIDFSTLVLDETASNLTPGAETAKGAMSVKDITDLNLQIVKIQSQTTENFIAVKDALLGLKTDLMFAGDAIAQIGLQYMKTPFYKQIEILTEYLGIEVEMAILMREYFKTASDGTIAFIGMWKGLMDVVQDPSSLITAGLGIGNGPSKSVSDVVEEKKKAANEIRQEARENKPGASEYKAIQMEMAASRNAMGVSSVGSVRRYGGLLEAAGGMVTGPSHENGGVRGTGSFNNIEVEGGEAIINKKSTAMFLPLLSKLNELGGGVAFTNSSAGLPWDNIVNNKTINLKIDGKLDYVTNGSELVVNDAFVFELAEKIADITSGKSYGGVY